MKHDHAHFPIINSITFCLLFYWCFIMELYKLFWVFYLLAFKNWSDSLQCSYHGKLELPGNTAGLEAFPLRSTTSDNLPWADPWNGKHSPLMIPSPPHPQSLSLWGGCCQNFFRLFLEKGNSVLVLLGTWSEFHCILKNIPEVWGV